VENVLGMITPLDSQSQRPIAAVQLCGCDA
jgi:hypothetical protein